MSDERTLPPPDNPLEPRPASNPPPSGATPGGYEYEVVRDDAAAPTRARRGVPGAGIFRRIPNLARRGVGLAVVGLIVGAAATWALMTYVFDGGGSDDSATRVDANVANIINAFSQGQPGSSVQRYEGQLPPGYPEDIPTYPGAKIVSSLVQLSGDDALFLAVYDTKDQREDVAAYFRDKLDADNLQIDGSQESDASALLQFSKTDNADVSGLVLVAESTDRDITTLFYSVDVVSGADKVELSPFVPHVSRPLPADFPEQMPRYPDAIVIETVAQRESARDLFGVAFITRDRNSAVLDFYRTELEKLGWTVSDGDASQSNLEDAQAINFESDDGKITGSATAGTFAEDRNYTRVELQLQATR